MEITTRKESRYEIVYPLLGRWRCRGAVGLATERVDVEFEGFGVGIIDIFPTECKTGFFSCEAF
jgi:hypothetical protein